MPTARTIPALALSLLALAIAACAEGYRAVPAETRLGGADTQTLPGRWCGDLFIASVRLNGSEPMDFLLDTGAGGTLIDDDAAEAAGITLNGSGQRVTGSGGKKATMDGSGRVETLQLGPVTMTGFDAHVTDLSAFDPYFSNEGRHIAGILGFPLFSGATLTIDYPAREVTVSIERLDTANRDNTPPEGQAEAWFKHTEARPRILVEVAGRELDTLVDTGYNGRFSADDFDQLPHAGEPFVSGASRGVDGVRVSHAAYLSTDAAVGLITFATPLVETDAKGAKIGAEAMRNHVWTFDPAAKLVRVRGPAFLASEPETTIGFAGAAETEDGVTGIRVLALQPDSPAARDGVQEGDLVTAINGSPDIACGAVSERTDEGGPLVLSVLRDGQSLEITTTALVASPPEAAGG